MRLEVVLDIILFWSRTPSAFLIQVFKLYCQVGALPLPKPLYQGRHWKSVSIARVKKTNPDQIYVITFSSDFLSTSLAVAVDGKRLSKPHLFFHVSMQKLKFKDITKNRWRNRNFHVKRIRKNGTVFLTTILKSKLWQNKIFIF